MKFKALYTQEILIMLEEMTLLDRSEHDPSLFSMIEAANRRLANRGYRMPCPFEKTYECVAEELYSDIDREDTHSALTTADKYCRSVLTGETRRNAIKKTKDRLTLIFNNQKKQS